MGPCLFLLAIIFLTLHCCNFLCFLTLNFAGVFFVPLTCAWHVPRLFRLIFINYHLRFERLFVTMKSALETAGQQAL